MSNHNLFSIKKAAIIALGLSTIILMAGMPHTHATSNFVQPAGDITLSIKGGWKLHLIVDNPTNQSFPAITNVTFEGKFHHCSASYLANMLVLPETNADFSQRSPVLFGVVHAILSAENLTISNNGTVRFGYITIE